MVTGDHVAVMLNNLGSLSDTEMNILAKEVCFNTNNNLDF